MRSPYRGRFLPYLTFSLFIALIMCLYIILFRPNSPGSCTSGWFNSEDKSTNDEIARLGNHELASALLRHQPVIFIGGFPRSGTTLMRAMIDAHPDVRCGEETRVIPRLLFMRNNWVNDEVELKRLNNAGVDANVLGDAISAFISEIIVKHGEQAKRYCNKDPFVMKSALYVAQLYKQAKFIFMIRDGRAAIHSVVRRKVTISGFDLSNFEQCLSKWDKAVETMWKQCQELGLSRCLPVWYEMLVQNPRKVGAKVTEFLDLPWNDSVLHHHELIGKPGGVKLSAFERSSDQVEKPIYLSALKEFVGKVPANVEKNLTHIAPMIEFFGYDVSPDPDYTKIRLPNEYQLFYDEEPGNGQVNEKRK